MAKEIVKIPDLGGAEEVEVIEISVAPGDDVSEEQSLLVLESDKATMEVPSPMAGKVSKVLVKEGDTVSAGSEIVELELTGDAAADEEVDDAQQDQSDQPESQGEGDESADRGDAPADDGHSKEESTAATSSSVEEFKLPDLGTDEQVDVIELSVAVGDRVEEGQTLGMLESDKATMDVPAPFAGEVTELLVKEGDKVGTGAPFARIRTEVEASEQASEAKHASSSDDEDKSKDSKPADREVATKPASAASAAEPATSANDRHEAEDSPSVYAGPAVRQLARELGVSLEQVKGTGPKGRIQKDDLNLFVKEAVNRPASSAAGSGGLPQVPEVDFGQFGETELVAMTKVQVVTATNMQRSWLNAPHVTHFDDADITEMEAFRQSLKAEGEKRKIKLTPLPFLLVAAAGALRAHPNFNRSLHTSGKHFVQKKYIHIGVAVDTPRGLLVPVVRDVDQKGVWELAEEVSELAAKAREGKLSMAEMQGGCFTISSLGAIGGTGFTPIVNVPEVAILAVSRAQIRPVWNGTEFVPRQLLPLGLSYDHRAVNGVDAGHFMTHLVETIGDLRRLLL